MPQPCVRLGHTILRQPSDAPAQLKAGPFKHFRYIFQYRSLLAGWGIPFSLQFSSPTTLFQNGAYHFRCSFQMPRLCLRLKSTIFAAALECPAFSKAGHTIFCCNFPMPQPCLRLGHPIFVVFSNAPALFKAGLNHFRAVFNVPTLLKAGAYHLCCSFPIPQPGLRLGHTISAAVSMCPSLA